MDDIELIIDRISVNANKLNLEARIYAKNFSGNAAPRVVVIFESDNQMRRLPLLFHRCEDYEDFKIFRYHYVYQIKNLFYKHSDVEDLKLHFSVYHSDSENQNVDFKLSDSAVLPVEELDIQKVENEIQITGDLEYRSKPRPSKFAVKKRKIKRKFRRFLISLTRVYYKILCLKKVKTNRVAILSGRRDVLDGNLQFVYNEIKDNKNIDFKFLLFANAKGHKSLKNIIRFAQLYASSKVILIDDYFRLLNYFDKREQTKIVQLWHASGAFKTFGFSRLGKVGGPKQVNPNHRMYDYAIVSSKNIAHCYAEGFGINDDCVVATGIPRTDIFMDEQYAQNTKEKFYAKYPNLKDKKIILFAPTFRGKGQVSAYYPTEVFDINDFYSSLGDEWAVLVKLHPFCKERFEIDEKYKGSVIDLSDEDELNDLLFVTDLLVTDYSSVVYEASLLDINMIFYSFDLDEYISSRDFYVDYKNFVPGKIVYTQQDLIEAIRKNDFESEKIVGFKKKYFDDTDGCSSKRVAALIENILQQQ